MPYVNKDKQRHKISKLYSNDFKIYRYHETGAVLLPPDVGRQSLVVGRQHSDPLSVSPREVATAENKTLKD